MKIRSARFGLILLSLSILALGYLALWFLFPSILGIFGGFNIASFGLTLFFTLFILFPSVFIFRYAQGKPIRRWQMEIAQAYLGLVIVIALALLYDFLLPPSVPIPWRYFILPLATVVTAFYLLRRIPKVRKKIDELSKNW